MIHFSIFKDLSVNTVKKEAQRTAYQYNLHGIFANITHMLSSEMFFT